MNRVGLIERKEAVRAEIARTRQVLARAQHARAATTDQPHTRLAREIAALEARLDALMAEEHALRIEIDQHR